MGYAYTRTGGLCCDSCGTPGARKRKCPHTVTTDGHTLPWCPAPALCAPCYARKGGLRGVHPERCREGAAAAQAEYDRIAERIAAGESQVKAAWGDWHAKVPTGLVGVLFVGADTRTYALVPQADYDPRARKFLSDYPDAQPCAALN